MRLNWIHQWDKLDSKTMQEVHIEPDHQMIKMGRKIIYCDGCKRWVSENDYLNYCRDGYHEYSKAIDPAELRPLPTEQKAL